MNTTTYDEFIKNILTTRGRFNCKNKYYERHHIVPKSIGGSDDDDNLIDLYAREHFEAHKLLALENPENDSLVYAWWMMAHVGDREVTECEYEFAKEHFVAMLKGQTKTEDVKDKISKGLIRAYENKPGTRLGVRLDDETKKRISIAMKGRWAGEKNPFFGKRHTQETKKKISESRSGKNNKKPEPIVQFDLNWNFIQLWPYQTQAAKTIGVSPKRLYQVCSNKGKTAGGFQWKYLYDQNRKNGTIVQGAISLGLIDKEILGTILNSDQLSKNMNNNEY